MIIHKINIICLDMHTARQTRPVKQSSILPAKVQGQQAVGSEDRPRVKTNRQTDRQTEAIALTTPPHDNAVDKHTCHLLSMLRQTAGPQRRRGRQRNPSATRTHARMHANEEESNVDSRQRHDIDQMNGPYKSTSLRR